MTCDIEHCGIQCVRKVDMPESLKTRKEIRVDPFSQGFDHQNSAINVHGVRLCFQVFLKPNTDSGESLDSKNFIQLDPVVSDIIYNEKYKADLDIVQCSDETSPIEGKL